MKRKLLFITTIAIVAFTGCKKIQSNLIEDSNKEPIYKMIGNVNGSTFDFTIDNETIFMSQGAEEMNNVPTLYTIFENKDNSTSLKLSIITPEKLYQPISEYSLSDKTASFLVHQKGCYNLGFSTIVPQAPVIMYSKNGQFVDETVEVPGYGIYNIPIRFKGLNSETYMLTINHGFDSHSFSARFMLHNSLNGIQFESNTGVNEHQWFLNGELMSDKPMGYIPICEGVNTITHIVNDNLGNKCSYSQIFYSELNNLKWAVKSALCAGQTATSNFEKVIITFVEDGITYSSAFAEENKDYSFSIKNPEYFIESIGSSSISFKFDTEFNGVLYNADKSKKKTLSDVVGTCKYIIE
ncbi:MAG: hypothetical protein AB8B72_01970 [Crocinitomicaceae bacterium]